MRTLSQIIEIVKLSEADRQAISCWDCQYVESTGSYCSHPRQDIVLEERIALGLKQAIDCPGLILLPDTRET